MSIQSEVWDNSTARGVIPTLPIEILNYKFLSKLQEEYGELVEKYHTTQQIDALELADCAIVLLNCATANNIDLIATIAKKSQQDVNRKPK